MQPSRLLQPTELLICDVLGHILYGREGRGEGTGEEGRDDERGMMREEEDDDE